MPNKGDFRKTKKIDCAMNFSPQQSGYQESQRFATKAVFQINRNTADKLDAEKKLFRLKKNIKNLETRHYALEVNKKQLDKDTFENNQKIKQSVSSSFIILANIRYQNSVPSYI